MPPLSLYVHFPWCVRKCPYCDFNSHTADDRAPRDRYVDALLSDLAVEGRRAQGRRIESIFLGGGTPSFFAPAEIGSVLDAARHTLNLSDQCEITMEANPGTLERGSLAEYREAGVTRLSLGAQSFDAGMLRTLGRIHDPDDIRAAYAEALEAGFDSINIDVMFALPGQDLAGAIRDVKGLLALSPAHVSYYQLTLEPNTVFYRRPPPGIPDDDLAWTIQEHGHGMFKAAGYEQYEISAFARAGHRCLHNLNYWSFGDYLAVGAGAHGKLTDRDGVARRYQKAANPLRFMETAGKLLEADAPVPISGDELGFEFMLNALRLTDGFSEAEFDERTGLTMSAVEGPVTSATADGLLEQYDSGRWRPTATGFRFLNDLQARFLP